MSKGQKELWTGLNEGARKILSNRNYKEGEFARRLSGSGIDAGESHRSARPDTVVGHGRSQRPGKTSSSAAPSTEPQPVARS